MEDDNYTPQSDPAKMMELLQEQLIDAKEELKTLVPHLRMGQAVRLILSMVEYPAGNFKEFEEEELIKAFSAWKRAHDVQVALGVHATLEGFVQARMRAEQEAAAAQQKEETNE